MQAWHLINAILDIVTNISEDHLGIDDINTIEDLAKVKSVVARKRLMMALRFLMQMMMLCMRSEMSLIAMLLCLACLMNNNRVISHCEEGGWAAIIEKGFFTVCKGEWRTRIARVNEVPLTMDGRAASMIKNILPSILAAAISDFDTKVIRRALQSFIPGPKLTPGRMNIFKVRNFEVMVDYVHNTDGFKELKAFMQHVNATVKTGIIGCAGDRRNEDIRLMGKYAAEIFDEIIIRHDEDGRGRSNEELTQLISEGIYSVNPNMEIKVISDEIEAMNYAMEHATKGSFIVVSSDKISKSIEFISLQKNKREEAVIMN